MAEARYVAAVPDSRNWLTVQLDSGGRVSLPYGLKVWFLGRSGGRDRFKILEGANKDAVASVVQKGPQESYLTPTMARPPAALVRFDSRSQRLLFGGRGPISAFSGAGTGLENGLPVVYTTIPPGTYDLAIPAYPSNKTRPEYDTWTRYHNTWFRVGVSTRGSRFLHAGQISDGCVTLRQFAYDGQPRTPLPGGFEDLARGARGANRGLIGLPRPERPAPVVSYDEVYRYLILRRRNDQSVGLLVVTDNGSI